MSSRLSKKFMVRGVVLHLSTFNRLLGVVCALLLCAGLGMAETAKDKKSNSGASARKPQAHSASSKGKSTTHSASPKGKVTVQSASARRTRTTAAAKTTVAASRSKTGTRSKGRVVEAKAKKPRGQQGIDAERAREIQEALIREKYLAGEPTGAWDAATKQAMTGFQIDHGWQTRVTPDSRALIKLGLGPKHAGLINPNSISQSTPAGARDMQPGGGTSFQSN